MVFVIPLLLSTPVTCALTPANSNQHTHAHTHAETDAISQVLPVTQLGTSLPSQAEADETQDMEFELDLELDRFKALFNQALLSLTHSEPSTVSLSSTESAFSTITTNVKEGKIPAVSLPTPSDSILIIISPHNHSTDLLHTKMKDSKYEV
jgi:hypothetical protein